MAIELIDMIFQYLSVEIVGSPLLFGVMIASFSVILLLIINIPKWAVMSYTTPIILSLSSPSYHPLLLPEWVFYVVLIFLGILWSAVILKFKGD